MLFMAEIQMLFPIEPKEFWQKLKATIAEVLEEQNEKETIIRSKHNSLGTPLLKTSEVCAIFKITKPTLYEWLNQGKLPSVKIESRRYFRKEDIDSLIENSRVLGPIFRK
jgi:excisionase family DNA binding protein